MLLAASCHYYQIATNKSLNLEPYADLNLGFLWNEYAALADVVVPGQAWIRLRLGLGRKLCTRSKAERAQLPQQA